MKRVAKLLSGTTLAVTLLTGCFKEPLRGEGPIVTETRSLAAFSKIDLEGSRYAEVIYSPESKVEITGYANLVSAYQASVGNERLRFDYPNRIWVRNDNIRLKIYTTRLQGIRLSGSTKMEVRGGFTGNLLEAHMSGSGQLDIGTGAYKQLELYTSGSAAINAREVAAQRADINVSGSAAIKVQVSDYIKVRISGSGEVRYWGNPVTDIQVSGSGKAIKQ